MRRLKKANEDRIDVQPNSFVMTYVVQNVWLSARGVP